MKGQTRTAWRVFAVVLASAALASAQSSSLSGSDTAPAQVGPGTVNYVEGDVMLNGQSLSRDSIGSAVLKPGETLNTSDGYAELLLTPGVFLRVGNNSELQLPEAGLAGAQVQLLRGSAMLEVDQLINGTRLTVGMDNASAKIEKNGLYSFNATGQVIQTFDGKLVVALNDKTVELGKHDQVELTSDNPLKRRSFNEDNAKVQPLYVWSKARSADEAQDSLQSSQNAESYASAGPGWYWDPYFNAYGFWPLAGSIYSPFGWGFYSPAYFGYYGGFYGSGWGYGYPGRYWGRHWRGHPGGTVTRVAPRSGFHRMQAPRFSSQPRFSAQPHFSAPGGHFSGGFGGRR